MYWLLGSVLGQPYKKKKDGDSRRNENEYRPLTGIKPNNLRNVTKKPERDVCFIGIFIANVVVVYVKRV